MKFSIITINYNNAEGLRKTIESVINQTYKDYEYIIIDGGSTDGSTDVIKEYADKITYWISEKDDGIYNAMNKGVAVAKGDYCNFMNSGDVFYNKTVLEKVDDENYVEDIMTGDLLFNNGCLCISPKQVTMKDFYYKTLFHQASFIRTSLLKEKPYDETLKIASDWKFFFEQIAIEGHSYIHLPFCIALFEVGGISANAHDLIRKEQYQVIHKYLPQNVIKDYEIMINGEDYYDKFFMTLKHSRLKRIIYSLNMFFVRIISLFIKLQWINKFPPKIK